MAPYSHWYGVGVLALLATALLSVSIPVLIGEAIDVLRTGSDPTGVLPYNAMLIAIMGAVLIFVRWGSRLLFFTPGRLVEAQVKHDLVATLIKQQPVFYDRWPTGDLVSRASSDVNFLRLLSGFVVMQIINATVSFGLGVGQMMRISPTLALYTLIPILVGFGVIQIFIKRMFTLVKLMQEDLAALSDHVLSSYQGVATIHGFTAAGAFMKRFDASNERYRDTSMKRADMRAVISPTMGLTATFNVFLVLYVGGPMAIHGDVSIGELVAFTSLLTFLTGPLRSVSFLVSAAKQSQAALERIDVILQEPPLRPDLPDAIPAPTAPAHLHVEHLSFAYPDEPDQEVLHDISFDLPAGATLGILGPTGSGKTTLLRCLARLYNPPVDSVFVDGNDITAIDLDGWRRTLAFVPQRAFLFSESVAQNILLGDVPPSELAEALSLAAMDVDVAALPQGKDTRVGEAGVMLSGGQRQRTALARGLIRSPGTLILDDVLSAVDHSTESQLIQSLRDRGTTPTTVIVANRISALQHADLILVMEAGHVVDRGRHSELCERPGLYRDTWERQREGEEQ